LTPHTLTILLILLRTILIEYNSIQITKDLTPEKGPMVRMTVYVDADHAYDIVTGRSITGILVMLNISPIRWISKRQKKVETSTYRSESVVSMIATELILEVSFILWSLGVSLDWPALRLEDSVSVV
jgi:hypothetical protein